MRPNKAISLSFCADSEEFKKCLQDETQKPLLFKALLENIYYRSNFNPDLVKQSKLFADSYNNDPLISHLLKVNAGLAKRKYRIRMEKEKAFDSRRNSMPDKKLLKNCEINKTLLEYMNEKPKDLKGSYVEANENAQLIYKEFIKKLKPKNAAKSTKIIRFKSVDKNRLNVTNLPQNKPMTAYNTPLNNSPIKKKSLFISAANSRKSLLNKTQNLINKNTCIIPQTAPQSKNTSYSLFRSVTIPKQRPQTTKNTNLIITGLNNLINSTESTDFLLKSQLQEKEHNSSIKNLKIQALAYKTAISRYINSSQIFP